MLKNFVSTCGKVEKLVTIINNDSLNLWTFKSVQITKEWLFFLLSLTHFSPCCIAITLEKIRKSLGFLFSRGIAMQDWGEMGSTILGQWPIVRYPEIVENLQVFLKFQGVQIWVKYGQIWENMSQKCKDNNRFSPYQL